MLKYKEKKFFNNFWITGIFVIKEWPMGEILKARQPQAPVSNCQSCWHTYTILVLGKTIYIPNPNHLCP